MVSLFAGLSAGWITFVNTFKHEQLHFPSFQIGCRELFFALPSFSFTPEARNTWPAFVALVALLLIDVQLASRARLRQESSRRQSDRRQAGAIDRAIEAVEQSTEANLAVLRVLESFQANDPGVPQISDQGAD